MKLLKTMLVLNLVAGAIIIAATAGLCHKCKNQ